MLALARWLMRGTPYAVGGAALASLVPWLFWLGAAIAALVTLRKGFALRCRSSSPLLCLPVSGGHKVM